MNAPQGPSYFRQRSVNGDQSAISGPESDLINSPKSGPSGPIIGIIRIKHCQTHIEPGLGAKLLCQ